MVEHLVLRNLVRTKCARGEFAEQICASIEAIEAWFRIPYIHQSAKWVPNGTPCLFGGTFGLEKPCAHKVRRGEFAEQICASIEAIEAWFRIPYIHQSAKWVPNGTPCLFGGTFGFEKPCAHKVRPRRICRANLRLD
ncbi:MAG: hypothetical protein E7584_02425 [Ruminococcaceae bacterium]|nr:hypothetical protein [Oscillospiraceae bacterium]